MTTSLSLSSTLHPSDSFHLTSTTQLALSSPESNCTLHLHFTLPPLTFIDPYELALYSRFFTFTHWGPASLELPVHSLPVHQANSGFLLNVPLSLDYSHSQGAFEIKVPLHLRYGEPVSGSTMDSTGGYYTTEMDWPLGFVACKRPLPGLSQSQTTLSLLPPELSSSLNSQKGFIYAVPRVPPQVDGADLSAFRFRVRVPVGDLNDLRVVEPGMVVLILVSFFYLVWVSWGVSRRMGRANEGSSERVKMKGE